MLTHARVILCIELLSSDIDEDFLKAKEAALKKSADAVTELVEVLKRKTQ